MRTPEQTARYYATRRAKAAAKAIAEGRIPGRPGAPPRLTLEEKEARRIAKNRKSTLMLSARKKARRAANALAAGRIPGIVGTRSKRTPEERHAASLAKSAAFRLRNLEKRRVYEAKKAREKRAAIKAGTYNPRPVKFRTAEDIKLQGRKDSQHRRARIRNAGGRYTKDDIIRLMAEQEGKCAICGTAFGDDGYHVDHYVPLSKGGTNDPSNLKLTHPVCNLKKGAKLPTEFTTGEEAA